jgi:hypothetical protein
MLLNTMPRSSVEACFEQACPVLAQRSEQGEVPRIGHFYGITITMYWDEPHHSRPHFHARYGEYKVSIDPPL